MNWKRIALLIISCVLTSMVASFDSFAQEKKVGPDEQKEIELKIKLESERYFKILGSNSAFGNTVKGAPFSATATTESIQTLIDGNQIINRNESTLYRDNEGRTRIEQTLGTIGKWVAGGEAKQLITINDPVAGVNYSLDPNNRTAYKGNGIYAAPLPDGAFYMNRDVLPEKRIEITGDIAPDKQRKKLIMVKDSDANGKKTELLGKQVLEGVAVELTRTTLTIPAGEIGNTMPIEIVDETWYSPELQMVVMSKHSDPRSGETTYRLTNINRSEPDHALFEVPPDYTVKSDKLSPAVKKEIFIKEDHEQ
ncbi:MAG: hypothetical protein J2P41_18545 [Blastocatellia bacterium]|nr:hypothetical protein [Blastocatellia bacterium]